MTIQDEIENYLNKAHSILFVEVDEERQDGLEANPLIYFLFTNIQEFNIAGIHKKISDFFKDGQSKFLIFLKEKNAMRVSIVNKMNGDTININNPQLRESINDFLIETKETDKIVMLTAFVSSNEFVFHEEAVKSRHVTLDGYSLVYN